MLRLFEDKYWDILPCGVILYFPTGTAKAAQLINCSKTIVQYYTAVQYYTYIKEICCGGYGYSFHDAVYLMSSANLIGEMDEGMRKEDDDSLRSCAACKKSIKKEAIRCLECQKTFHPGCAKIHRRRNESNEFVLCKGITQKISIGNVEYGETVTDSRSESGPVIGYESNAAFEDKLDLVLKEVKNDKK